MNTQLIFPLLFALGGLYSIYSNLAHHAQMGMCSHSTYYGISEMTVMWFAMALAHYYSICKCSQK